MPGERAPLFAPTNVGPTRSIDHSRVAAPSLLFEWAASVRPATGVQVAKPAGPSGSAGLAHHANEQSAGKGDEGLSLVVVKGSKKVVEQSETALTETPCDPPSRRREVESAGSTVWTRSPAHVTVPLEAIDKSDGSRLAEAEHLGDEVNGRSVEELIDGAEQCRRALGMAKCLPQPVGDGSSERAKEVCGLARWTTGHLGWQGRSCRFPCLRGRRQQIPIP